MKRAVLAIGAFLLTAAACGDDEAGPPRLADLSAGRLVRPPTPAYSGACPFPETERLVSSEADWRQVWSQLFACTTPVPALPSVDFGREMLVLAALGGRSSSGYSVSIRSAAVDGAGVLQVKVTERRPGPDCVVAAVITYPVAVARVPRFDVPAAFETGVEVIGCR